MQIARRGLLLACTLAIACGAPLAAARVLAPGDITVEATGPSGAVVEYDAGGLNCDPPSGSTFPLGNTTVTCRDGDGTEVDSFRVKVQDTTGPAITVPAAITVSTSTPPPVAVTYTPEPSATDLVDGTVSVTCSPVSGSSFNAGTTTVNCSASDSRGNSSAAGGTVTVTVNDTTPPVISNVPANISRTTQNPAGITVDYTNPTATDNVDGSIPVSCIPASGSSFAVGTTPVNCSAVDSHGNSANASFNVTVTLVDETPPVLSVPSGISEETETNAPKVVTYSASATDNVDGPLPISCTHPSGSAFPIGTTSVSCTATDSHGNSSSASFSVTVALVDHTAPALTGVPADRHVEANGPSGSVVNYATPTATDAVDGPIAVTCSPSSGFVFALGTTTVTCTATDDHGNTGSASFAVVVADTTPPTVVIPGALGIRATSPEGIPRTNPVISSFLSSASAADIVDPNPVVTNNAPAFLPIGTTDITFTARDASGNGISRSSPIVVSPEAPPGTPPMPIPPAPRVPDNPRTVNVTLGDGTVRLAWPAVPGAKQYLVYRSETGARRTAAVGHGQLVYSGTARTFTDRGLTNGVEYRYVVVVEDAVGNHSVGIAVIVVPKRDLLRSPKNGARLSKAPRLVWTADAEADYYNAQLVRAGVKILSIWPTRARLQLKKSWKFEGKRYTLRPGLYTWYVWPGYGARRAVDYGELMGSRTFRIVAKRRR